MGNHPKILYCGTCDVTCYDSLMQDAQEVNFRKKHLSHNRFKSFGLIEICFGDGLSVAYRGTDYTGNYINIKEETGIFTVIDNERFKLIEEQHTRKLMESAEKHKFQLGGI